MSDEKYMQFFRDTDKDGSGSLTLPELTNMLRGKGYSDTDVKIRQMFNKFDTSADGQISLEEYKIGMGMMPPQHHKSATMRSVFQGFDLNADGKIDKSELFNVFKEMGRYLSADEVDRMMALCDKDGSGSLDYEEFITKVFGKQA